MREIVETTPRAVPHYTFSAGVAAWDGRETLAARLARADSLLYAAKFAGRNRVKAPVEEVVA